MKHSLRPLPFRILPWLVLPLFLAGWSYCDNIVYFTPKGKVDQVIERYLGTARREVLVANYHLSDQRIGSLLVRLSKRPGTTVRVILDEPPPPGLLRSLGTSVHVKQAKSSLFHVKVILIDGKLLLTGSANLTTDHFTRNHNTLLVLDDPGLIETYRRKFFDWWDGSSFERIYRSGKYEAYFSPETDSETVIIGLINAARKSLRFAEFDFTAERIAEAMVRRRLAGVDVAGIIERTKVFPYSTTAYLRDFDVPVRASNLSGLLHDKFLVIDGTIVVTGSYNLSASAHRNTETVLVIRDERLAGQFLKEWNELWRWYALPSD